MRRIGIIKVETSYSRLRRICLIFCLAFPTIMSGPSWSDDGSTKRENFYRTGWGHIYLQKVAAYDGTPKRGGTLKVVITGETPVLNPFLARCPRDSWLAVQLYDTLMETDILGLRPGLAESWDISENGLVYTFKIRRAKFHNGQPVTAQDAAFSLERQLALSISGAAQSLAPISLIRAVSDRVLKIKLNAPDPSLLYKLAGVQGIVVSAAGFGTGSPATPISSGPFHISGRASQRRLKLTVNKDYWEKAGDGRQLPLVEQIDIQFLPVQKANALESKDFDLCGPAPHGWRINDRIRHIHYDSDGRLSRLKRTWLAKSNP